jgi:hypothetical protein
MVKKVYHITPILITVFSFGACNLEVGNPDGVESRFAAGQSLSLSMTSSTPCEAAQGTCFAAPVLVNDPGSVVTFEITSARFQLAGTTLMPLAEEEVHTRADVLGGTILDLQSPISESVTGVSLRFAAASDLIPAIELSGNFLVHTSSGNLAMPLTLQYSGNLVAQAVIPAGGFPDALVFNADQWFDFRDAKINLKPFFTGAKAGVCADSNSGSCTQYRDQLARLVSERIAKSLFVKTRSTNQKAISKGKIGG